MINRSMKIIAIKCSSWHLHDKSCILLVIIVCTGVASYGTLGHVLPSTSNCLILQVTSKPHKLSSNIRLNVVRARGAWGLQPQTWARPLLFGQKLHFSGRSQQPKMEKNTGIFLYLLNEKTEFILSSEIKCPKSGIFTNNYRVGWVGQWGKVILQVRIAVFFGRRRKNFWAMMARKKLARTPMGLQSAEENRWWWWWWLTFIKKLFDATQNLK